MLFLFIKTKTYVDDGRRQMPESGKIFLQKLNVNNGRNRLTFRSKIESKQIINFFSTNKIGNEN